CRDHVTYAGAFMRRTVLFWMTLCWSQMVWGPTGAAHPGCEFAKHVEEWRKAPLKQSSVRPPATYEKASAHWPIRIHWQEGVTEAYADEILLYTEESWRRLFTEMGFLAPHPDGVIGGDASFDVYIVTDLDPLIGGYASFSGFFEETERADAFGYLVINNNIDIRVRRFVVAHELFHTSQMAY